MMLMIFSHLMMMPRMKLSLSGILILLLCLSHECTARHLSSIDSLAMDDNAKLLSHPTVKGFANDLLTVPDNLNLKTTENRKDQSSKFDNDHHKKTDSKSQHKKDVNNDQKLKKVQEELVIHHHHQHQPKSRTTVTFRVPPRNKRIHQQPGFNLDYSPPKTHPPSHN